MRKQAIIALLLLSGMLWALKPSREYTRHPDQFGLIYKSLEVTTADSLRIASWFFPAQRMPQEETMLKAMREGILPEYTAESEPLPTIVVANGDAGNMGDQINFVVAFCPLGYNVVLFDWRGFGESDPWETERDMLSYKEYIDDYIAVLDAVFAQPEVDNARVVVYGGSTGAYLSLAAAVRDERVSICVLRALMTSFDDVIPILHSAKPDRDIRAPEGYPEELIPVNAAKNFKRPVLLIVGEKDEVTPVWMSEKIYSMLPGEKELWAVPDATHGGGTGPVYSDFTRFTNKVDGFLKAQWEQ